MTDSRCEFCGAPGCHWENHEEARIDAAREQRYARRRGEPDHIEGDEPTEYERLWCGAL